MRYFWLKCFEELRRSYEFNLSEIKVRTLFLSHVNLYKFLKVDVFLDKVGLVSTFGLPEYVWVDNLYFIFEEEIRNILLWLASHILSSFCFILTWI